MNNYKALIVDDEPKLRKVLEFKLAKYCPDIQLVSTAGNAEEAFTEIKNLKPDIIFLDISMPGESGFDLLNRFDSIDFEIIFVTGFNDYVLDALKVSAVDYLLKPVVTANLVAAVEKAKSRIEDRQKVKMYHVLMHNINHLGEQDSKIAIPGVNSYDFVKISDIIRLEGWQKYTRIYLMDGNCITSSYNLGVFREMLSGYDFFSTHKSHLINIKMISRYLKEGTVIMSDHSEVPVARRKREEFAEQVLKDFLMK